MVRCLDAVVTLTSGMVLTLGTRPPVVAGDPPIDIPVTTQKRKLPGKGERLDTVPLLAITPAERQPPRVPWDSRPAVKRTCVMTIALIAAGNRDPITNLDDTLTLLDRVAKLFAHPRTLRAFVPDLLIARCVEEANFDRSAYSEQYDYHVLRAEVDVIEVLG
jgi:hypothetical protein